jgi:hypothetical protein
VLLEHMSTVERLMPFRVLRYMTKIWSRFEHDFPGQPLPVIVPVVLHHSKSGWTAPTRFSELFDLDDDLRVAIAPFVPDFAFVLDDNSKLDDEALRGRAVTDVPINEPLYRQESVASERRRDQAAYAGRQKAIVWRGTACLAHPNVRDQLRAYPNHQTVVKVHCNVCGQDALYLVRNVASLARRI